jgi:hypothetical protein
MDTTTFADTTDIIDDGWIYNNVKGKLEYDDRVLHAHNSEFLKYVRYNDEMKKLWDDVSDFNNPLAILYRDYFLLHSVKFGEDL